MEHFCYQLALNFYEKHHISCLDHLFSECFLLNSVFLCLLLNFLRQSLYSLFYKAFLFFFKVIAEFFNYEKIWKMVTDFFKEVSTSAGQSLKSIKKLSMRDACSFSVILVGPRICGVNPFAVRKSRN